MSRERTRISVGSWLLLAAAVGFWLAVAGGRGLWSVPAVAAVLAAAMLARIWYRPAHWALRPAGVARFVLYFLRQSWLSGVDVAKRVLGPRHRLHPGLVEFESTLRTEPARILLANTLSLLPGTLCCRLEGSRLLVHALDKTPAVESSLRELERAIAATTRREEAPHASHGSAA